MKYRKMIGLFLLLLPFALVVASGSIYIPGLFDRLAVMVSLVGVFVLWCLGIAWFFLDKDE